MPYFTLNEMFTQFIHQTVQFRKYAAIFQLYAHDRRHLRRGRGKNAAEL
jgi:hypothetical protein